MGLHTGWPEYADQVCNLTGMLADDASPCSWLYPAVKACGASSHGCSRLHAAKCERNTSIRGMQATFFLALSVAGQLGTASLAAHQVVAQLWLLPAYVVDAFAVAGTVLGSRLVATIELPESLR